MAVRRSGWWRSAAGVAASARRASSEEEEPAGSVGEEGAAEWTRHTFYEIELALERRPLWRTVWGTGAEGEVVWWIGGDDGIFRFAPKS
jgi:hypothetical protein